MSLFDLIKSHCISAANLESVESLNNISLVPFGSDVVVDEDIVISTPEHDYSFKKVVDGSITDGYWQIVSINLEICTMKLFPETNPITIEDVSKADLKDITKWRFGVDIGMTGSRTSRGNGWKVGAIFKTLLRGVSNWYKGLSGTEEELVEQVVFNIESFVGVSEKYALADHCHGTPYIVREDLSDQCGGGNVVFNTSEQFVSNSLDVWYNGLYKGVQPKHFEEIDNSQFRCLDFIPIEGEEIVVSYVKFVVII